jgi:hypothetical protein
MDLLNGDAGDARLGTALLWVALRAMWEVGYAYAIIGGVGPQEFYARAVAATLIDGSTPGIFAGMLADQGTDA